MPGEWPTFEWWANAPILILTGTALFILLADLAVPQRRAGFPLLAAFASMALAFGAIMLRVPEGTEAFGRTLRYDALGRWGALLSLGGGALIALISTRSVRDCDLPAAEYYALLVLSVLGMVVLCLSFELLTIFLAIEIVAVGIYILAGLRSGSTRSSEAALKYFILGAFTGGFLILGFAFLYGGAGGKTLIEAIGPALGDPRSMLQIGCVMIGLALALAGFAFKLTLVPFHLYAADVFEGAPAPVAAFLATGSKVAAFVALIHLLGFANDEAESGLVRALSRDLTGVLWILAALSIVIGNLVALLQRNIKRMLAYSSIAHSGYVLLAVLVYLSASGKRADAETAAMVYLVAYVLMNVLAFGVAASLGEKGEGNIEDYAGLARPRPLRALAMTLAMLSLTGIPATMGFVGKFMVFAAAVDAGFVSLVILAVLGSALSAYYYLRVVVVMYMHEPRDEAAPEATDWIAAVGLALAAAPIVVCGLLPQLILRLLEAI